MKKFRIHYSFIITLICFILSPYQIEFLKLMLALFIHELGHLFFIYLFNIKINNLKIYSIGALIDLNDLSIAFIKEILIYSGGIIFNILGIMIFANINKYMIIIILFNLIPIYPLDGYNILKCIISYFIPYRISLYIISILGIIILFIITYFLILNLDGLLFINLLYLWILNIKKLLDIKMSYKYFILDRYLYKYRLKPKKIRFNYNLDLYLYRYHNIYTYINDKKIAEDVIIKLKYE